MFNPVNDVENLPYSNQNIIKIYRGMNMVNVSIGDYTSEPSEVYITTSQEGDELSTFIVFYLVNPASQAIYAYGGNPFQQEERISVELEAKEFVEEMGAILEDIGWEGMPEDEKALWLENQYLFRREDGKKQDEDEDEVVELTEDAIMDETVDEELESLDDAVEPEDALDQIAREDQPEASDDTSDDDTQAVFIEEKFDELLKKAFLKTKDSTDETEEEAAEVESEDDEPVEEPASEEDLEVKAVTETRVLDRKEIAEVEVDEDREKVLRFLSKI